MPRFWSHIFHATVEVNQGIQGMGNSCKLIVKSSVPTLSGHHSVNYTSALHAFEIYIFISDSLLDYSYTLIVLL
ncbi:hypothetical protein NC651_040126 [Populus alba x Populus x berolinensis]|nr:hypothetical protein NC651_040126 [Populus alba x Populus x berolinensis]